MATTAASSGSFLITPNVGLMIWTLLLFGISMYVLWKLAFPRIAQALERRQHAIEESIDAADRTRKEADEILAEYRERLREARGQADEIIQRVANLCGDLSPGLAIFNQYSLPFYVDVATEVRSDMA